MVQRVGRTRRYEPLPEGLKALTALMVLRHKVIQSRGSDEPKCCGPPRIIGIVPLVGGNDRIGVVGTACASNSCTGGSEALFRSRLSPSRPANGLNPAEIRSLRRAIRQVLHRSVRGAAPCP